MDRRKVYLDNHLRSMKSSDALPRPARDRRVTRAAALQAGLALAFALATGGCDRPAPASATEPAAADGGEGHGLVVLARDPAGAGPEELAQLVVQGLDPGERTYFHDFDRIPYGDVVDHTFHLVNTDSAPVTVQKINPSCGCMSAKILRRLSDGGVETGASARTGDILTVPAGGFAELVVRADSRHVNVKNTDKLGIVHLATTSLNRPFIRIEAHLIVSQPFRTIPPVFDLGRIAASAGGHGQLIVVQDGDSGDEIVEIAETPDDLVANLTRTLEGGRDHWYLNVEWLPPVELGRQQRTIRLATRHTDGGTARPFEVTVTALVSPDVAILPERVLLRGRSTDTLELVSHLAGHAIRILGAEITGPHAAHFDVRWTAPRIDDSGASPHWNLTFERVSDPGVEYASGTVVLRLEDPQYPAIEFEYGSFAQ